MSSYTLSLPTIATAHSRCALALGNRETKKIGNNTYLRKTKEPIAPYAERFTIQYHNTDVIHVYPDFVQLNSGGWRTITTRDRFNGILTCINVYAEKGVWYVRPSRAETFVGGSSWEGPGSFPVFEDGIRLRADGTVEGAGQGDAMAVTKALKKRIEKYVVAYAEAAVDGKVEAPSGGDCWFCSMRVVAPSKDAGKTLGEVGSGADHLLEHMKESYFVPSLVRRAAETCGNGWLMNMGFPLLWATNLETEERLVQLARHRGEIKREIKKVLKRYLGRQLGLGA